jgi:hypothetical protein
LLQLFGFSIQISLSDLKARMNVLLTTVLTGCLHPIVSVIVGSEGQPLISTVWLKDKLGLWSLYMALMWQKILIYLSWLAVIINNLLLIHGQ